MSGWGRVASENQMIYKVTSTGPLDEIERRLQESAARQKFGVVAVYDLQEMLQKTGVDLAVECRIYEVCNPLQAKKGNKLLGKMTLRAWWHRIEKVPCVAPRCQDFSLKFLAKV
jgi:hypothetical protein